MRFAQIEELLGRDIVLRVQGSVGSAYQAAGGDQESLRAVRQLLIGMLAAAVTTHRYLPQAEQLAAEDAERLNTLVRKIKDMTPAPEADGCSAPAAVIPFPGRQRRAPAAVAAKSGALRGALADVTRSCAAKVASLRDLAAQTNGLVAQSQVQIARSRQLLRQPSAAARPA
jgi:hypothetical protein